MSLSLQGVAIALERRGIISSVLQGQLEVLQIGFAKTHMTRITHGPDRAMNPITP
jgi:hypothetical protein